MKMYCIITTLKNGLQSIMYYYDKATAESVAEKYKHNSNYKSVQFFEVDR